jgi:mono/diheme cytochrome c family protein
MGEALMKQILAIAISAAVWVYGISIHAHSQTVTTIGRFDYIELTKVPEKARGRKNPMNGDPNAPRGGQKLFAQHCVECHGASGEGGKKAPSLRVAEVQQATPGTLFWILTNGVVRRGMPVWSKLPEPQRWDIVSYIKGLGAASLPNPTNQPGVRAGSQ